jgi:hypothetical protein
VSLPFLSCLLLALGTTPTAPRPAADCQQHLDRAYEQLARWQHTAPGKVLVLRFAAQTTSQPPGKKGLTTATAHYLLVSQQDKTYSSSGDTDVYQDSQVQVSIARPQHTILITRTPPNRAATLAPWLKMRAQVQGETTITQCAVQGSGPAALRRVEARPLAGSALVGKVASVAYELDGRTDALRSMTMYYPLHYGMHSATLLIESQSYKAQDASVQGSALSHVLGPDQQLLPAYRHYQLLDQR